jgi:hypothetical protein
LPYWHKDTADHASVTTELPAAATGAAGSR